MARAVSAVEDAIAEGAVPPGGHIGTGKRSALWVAAEALGIGKSSVWRRWKMARSNGGVEKPRVRVKAGSQPIQAPPPFKPYTPMDEAYLSGPKHSFVMKPDNTFTFGACGDQHLCSKYARIEVNEKLYDAFAEAGCQVVFNTGNWIDGEARFNVHDLIVRGMDAQLRHLADAYPNRPGITTYAVAGDDHEGWYSQREGVDIGWYAEQAFRNAGRSDWINLGFMEAPVRMVSPHTGKASILSVVHPGGGSAYALSYAIQKIIESLDGGEKPAIGLYGHYHKLWAGNIRNVWCVQTGTGQDQTPFMRKKRLEAHVGGYICKATQDPRTGAIVRFQTECLRYFNQGYYADRWSHSGDVTHPQPS
jgi:hypothetical protein